MKLDELALANQQLADMLKSGMPLEGALREVCESCARGTLKAEFSALEQDLAAGKSLEDAIDQRNLPELYQHTLKAGAKPNQLPTVLNGLADHYAGTHAAWERLRSVLIYPILVLVAATCVSLTTSILLANLFAVFEPELTFMLAWHYPYGEGVNANRYLIFTWIPPAILITLVVVTFISLRTARIRREAEWILPAFKENKLATFASSMAVLIRGGIPLSNALGLIEKTDHDSRLAEEIRTWNAALASGESTFGAAAKSSRLLPPLFLWAVTSCGSNLADGFSKASGIFQSRANYKIELLLNTALPVFVLVLGGVIVAQTYPVMQSMVTLLDRLGS